MGFFRNTLDKYRSGQRGFTLVELLVVIAIIGVLATLVLLQLGTARARARDTKRIADVNQVRTAVEQYFEDHGGQYPTTIDDTTIGRYLTKIPNDPLLNQPYNYAYHESGSAVDGFQVWAQLEQTAAALGSDADLNTTQGGWTGEQMDATEEPADCADDTATPKTHCAYDQGIDPTR